MKVSAVVSNTKGDSGGGIGIRSMICMLSSFSELQVIHTDEDHGLGSWCPDALLTSPKRASVPETFKTKTTRLMHYYRNDKGVLSKQKAWELRGETQAIQVEALDLWFLGERISDGKVPLILHEHDLRWELNALTILDSPFYRTRLGRMKVTQSLMGPWMVKRAEEFELNAIRKAAWVFVVSERDREVLIKKVPEAAGKVSAIPSCVDTQQYSPHYGLMDGDKKHIAFVGKLDYIPNAEAVETICDKIAPAFGDDVIFDIVGKPVPKRQSPKNVIFHGYVPDVRPYLSAADICIVPLQSGSGMRMKILEYMALGRPVVSTTKGCEGLTVTNGKNIIIADRSDEFIKALSMLLKDDSQAKALGREGRKWVEEEYDWRVYKDKMRAVYEGLVR
jgi:glycosyltransferase involved in cell wall biosynthesis